MSEVITITTKSANTVKAYEFLEANKGQAFTIAEVAKSLDVTPAKVTAGIVSLAKKGVLSRHEEEIEGQKNTKKTFEWAQPVIFTFEETKAMSDKAVQLLQYLQSKDGTDMTAADIAEDLGSVAIAITGVVNGLVKRGMVFREEAVVEMPDGSEKTIKFIQLTDEGRAYQF